MALSKQHSSGRNRSCYFGRKEEDADGGGVNAFSFAIASYLIALERRMGHLPRKARSQMYDYLSYIITYLPWKMRRDECANYLTTTVVD